MQPNISPNKQLFVFERMRDVDVPLVMEIENVIYPYPWSKGNFIDSIHHG